MSISNGNYPNSKLGETIMSKLEITESNLKEAIEIIEQACIINNGESYRSLLNIDYGCKEVRVLNGLYEILNQRVAESDALVDLPTL
tara:strand:- start:676 stop:936 length:261 start_codon:yes stop_codon:yes gene_type:complete